MPTESEYRVIKQRDKKLYAKISLLNYNFQKVDEWQNVVIGTPTFSVDATSSIRRTCSINLIPKDKSFDVLDGSKIWLDKYIQIYLGIEDNRTREVVYTNMGIYMIENPSRAYSATDNTITIKGIDLMAKLTGLRNGNFEGVQHSIEADANIRNTIIAILEENGFKNYIIEESSNTVPNQIDVAIGGTYYDLLQNILDLFPNYEMFFDVDGVFHYQKIPTGKDEVPVVDDDLWKNILISYNQDYDFDSVKNYIEVFGGTHTINHYPTSGEFFEDTNDYDMTMNGISLYNNLKIGFSIPKEISKEDHLRLGIYSYDGTDTTFLGVYPLLDENGEYVKITKDVYYVARFKEVEDGDDYWLFLGEVTPYGHAQETNPNSPFCVNGNLGIVRIVLTGDEYNSIYSSDLARQRAEWELYTRCRLLDSINITCIPIYWLDVNKVIEVTLPNKQGTEEKALYITKSISTTFGENGTQTIKAMKYYPYYDFE